jgi:glycerol dehydrogenase-like iron-containing ADH family enzyme
MCITDIAVIVGAAAEVATLIAGIGSLSSKISEMRDDTRALRQDIQSCLQTMLLLIKSGNPGEPRN